MENRTLGRYLLVYKGEFVKFETFGVENALKTRAELEKVYNRKYELYVKVKE